VFKRARWVGGGTGTGFFLRLRLDAPDAAMLVRRSMAGVTIEESELIT
jgi:hypothetical protein